VNLWKAKEAESLGGLPQVGATTDPEAANAEAEQTL
jgi:hypothetical protein